MTLARIAKRVQQDHLDVFGAFHTDQSDTLDSGTLVLLGPQEPGFWAHFTASDEYTDGAKDPLDRWSKRAISDAADDLGATPYFPFGAPLQPFLSWATRSGRAWPSPVHLLVHDTAGLWVSYRGALLVPDRLDLPSLPANPCVTCTDQPCRTACPAGAMRETDYDLTACHAYLDSAPGTLCLETGCAVRKACPVSQKYHRMDAQSAFHMDQFHS